MARAANKQKAKAENIPAGNGHINGNSVTEPMEVDEVKETVVAKKSRGRPAKPVAVNGDAAKDTESNGSSSKDSSPSTDTKSVRGRKRRAAEEVPEPKAKKVKVSDSTSSGDKVSLSAPNVKGGVVLAVGMGDIGQLGLGPDIEERTRCAVVPGLPENIVAVAAGGLHSVCIDEEGKVYSWGCNDEGALGRITSTEEDNFSPGLIEGIDGKAVQISAGDCHCAALTEDGVVYAWGTFRDNNGPLGFVEKSNIQKTPRIIQAGNEPVVQIASGNNHMVLLTASGRVFTCGCGEAGQLGRVAEVFATRDSRNRNGFDVLLLPALVKVCRRGRRLVKFDAVWAGEDNTYARCADTNLIYACGLNNYNQMGDSDTNTKFQPILLKSLQNHRIIQIAGGQHHGLALEESTGFVYAMGRHDYGRLGLGEDIKKDALVPTKIETISDVRQVSAAGSVSVAVTNDGCVYGFGMGTSNQLSQGNEDDCWSPSAFGGKQLQERSVVSACVGGQHTVLLAIPKQK